MWKAVTKKHQKAIDKQVVRKSEGKKASEKAAAGHQLQAMLTWTKAEAVEMERRDRDPTLICSPLETSTLLNEWMNEQWSVISNSL